MLVLAFSLTMPALSACDAEEMGPTAVHPEPNVAATDMHGDRVPFGAVARLGTVRLRYAGDVTSLAFAPDGRSLASGGHSYVLGCELRLWDVGTGRAQSTRRFDCSEIYDVAYSPDGRVLAVAEDWEIAIVDPSSGEITRLLKAGCPVYGLAFSPDGKTLASSQFDKKVCLWEIADGRRRLELIGHTDRVFSVAFSSDGTTLASGSADRTCRVWNATSGDTLAETPGHWDRVTSVDFSPDGKILASGSWDRHVRLWEVATGKLLRRIRADAGKVECVAYSPKGGAIAAAVVEPNSAVLVWDPDTGKEIRRYRGRGERAVSFSPNGRLVAFGGRSSKITLWNPWENREEPNLQGHASAVVAMAFSADDQFLGSRDSHGDIFLWHVTSGRPVSDFAEREYCCSTIALSPTKNLLAIGRYDGSITLRDIAARGGPARLPEHKDSVSCASFSRNGRILAIGDSGGIVRVWDVPGQRELRVFRAHRDQVDSLALSPDGAILVSAAEREAIRWWNVATGKMFRETELHTNEVFVTFSPQGQSLALVNGDFRCELWSVPDGTRLREVNNVYSYNAAFSPDGTVLAVGDFGGPFRLVDVASGRELVQVGSLESQVRSLAFSGDGELLATGCEDTTIVLWDVHRLLKMEDDRKRGRTSDLFTSPSPETTLTVRAE